MQTIQIIWIVITNWNWVVIVGLGTIVAAIAAIWQARTSSKQVAILLKNIQPKVVIRLANAEHTKELMVLEAINIGEDVAKNITFKYDVKQMFFISNNTFLENGIEELIPGEARKIGLKKSYSDIKEAIGDTHPEINIHFSNDNGKFFNVKSKLDFQSFEREFSCDPIAENMSNMKKIADSLAILSKTISAVITP